MSKALFVRVVFTVSFAGVILAVAAAAAAETAWTVKSTNLRAGPDREYPVVTRVPAGVAVDVAGCVEGVTWCDVVAGPDRGWMYAGNLEFPYEGHRVVMLGHGAWWHGPIVPFAVGPYWDSYYVGRPWYGRRSYWVGHPYVARPYSVGPRAAIVHPGPGHVGPHSAHVAPHPAHVAPHPAHVAPHPVVVHPAPVPHPAHAAPKPAAPHHAHPKHP